MSKKPTQKIEWEFTGCAPGSEATHPEFTELLTAYAHAMWEWSRLEASLFLIFADTIEASSNKHSKALRAAFFSVISPKGRLDMIHSVAKAMWQGKTCWDEWIKLYNDCVKQLSVRGRIAHLVGYGYMDKRGMLVPVLAEAIHHPMSPRATKDTLRAGVTVAQLKHHVHVWSMLHERLSVFRFLVTDQKQLEASPEQLSHLLQVLQTLVDQTRKAP